MIIAIGLIPITNAMGGDLLSWIKISVILGLIASVSLLLTFFANKEKGNTTNAGENIEEKTSFFTSIKLLFQNKYRIIMLLVNTLVFILYGLSGATGIYYTKWVLKDENLVAVMGAVGLIPVVIGFAITGPLIKKPGLARTSRIALLIGVIGTVVRIIFPYSFIVAITFGLLVTFGTIPFMAVGGVLINNTVEYGEWKTGKRTVGMINSAAGFGAKTGNGLGAALVGWVLALGGYNADLAEQSQAAINSIIAVCIWIPGILMVLVYVLLRFYDLDAKYPQIVKELEAGKAK
jgi:GPH family glycoside/pentoside/hexuronide:cation symporter